MSKKSKKLDRSRSARQKRINNRKIKGIVKQEELRKSRELLRK